MKEDKKKVGKSLLGRVVRRIGDKSIVVQINRSVKHPVGKYVVRHTKIHAHDEKNDCKIGDWVVIKEGRPVSKMKSWFFVKKLNDQEVIT